MDPGGGELLGDAVSERRFPVLRGQSRIPYDERMTRPASVPWSFVERFREQAMTNHDQTLERLAERGGLAPEELWLIAHGKSLRHMGEIDERAAVEWLRAAIAEPVPKTLVVFFDVSKLSQVEIEELLNRATNGHRSFTKFEIVDEKIYGVTAVRP